ncbi:dethiobiotin synthase [Thermithiobacillus tepidarius DSM 3134]|uniref:dethiobiotin synthase n=1 Tax=Thermithiobacillus tepidarius TaxID=929 RepID=UPI000403A771|nr:dethiobiotin synthase [Thermithiobacillus tepidarius]
MRGFFVTGTDTGVGKTQVACALLSALAACGERVAGLKPVASGCRKTAVGLRNEDAEALMAAANVRLDYAVVNPYAFAPPIAPHWAARQAGVAVDLDWLVGHVRGVAAQAERVVVEGAGGFLVPLSDGASFADLACRLALPVILVVSLRLGAINHALLSAEAITRRGLPLAGWVGNAAAPGEAAPGTVESLQALLTAPCLGILPHVDGPAPWRALAAHLRLDQLAV